jgi:hypothetical protein
MNLKNLLLGIFITGTMLIGLPLAGCFLAGYPIPQYLEFPPQTRYVAHAPFSPWAFLAYTAFIVFIVGFFLARVFRKPAINIPQSVFLKGNFPWWGWVALVCCAICWILAWTRFSWFATLQPHTFFPLWLAFIILINATCFYRSGHCMVTERPGYFYRLFLISVIFWWFFEYLNRFVQNWHYTGSEYSPLSYFLLATLSFSTVLPAVLSMQELLRTFPRMEKIFKQMKPMPLKHPTLFAWMCLLFASAGLSGIGVLPDLLFPLLWISPLLIITSLQQISGKSNIYGCLATSDWRHPVSAAIAALICGCFWEMWNFYSLARWTYSVPLVHRFQIFEMPLLGYAGYLPFGLECAVIGSLLESSFQPPPRTLYKVT